MADWREPSAYAPLLGADRSLVAWEWLRRDPAYRAAARDALAGAPRMPFEDPAAAGFGLVAFEDPDLAVPNARPLWRGAVDRSALAAERGRSRRPEDCFAFERWKGIATLIRGSAREHLLLCDGLRTIRLDAEPGVLTGPGTSLSYRLEAWPAPTPRC